MKLLVFLCLFSLVSHAGDLKLEKALDSLGPSFISIKNQICSLPFDGPKRLKELETSRLGLSIKKQKWSKVDAMTARLKLKIHHPLFEQITIEGRKSSHPEKIIYSILYLQGRRNMKLHAYLQTQAGACFLIGGVNRYYVKENDAQHRVKTILTAEGDIEEIQTTDLEPKTLKEIYAHSPYLLKKAQVAQQNSKRVKIGVIDTGVDFNHPEIAYKIARTYPLEQEANLTHLRSNFIHGYDLKDNDQTPFDFDGLVHLTKYSVGVSTHGTQVVHALTKNTDRLMVVPVRYRSRGRGYHSLSQAILLLKKDGVRVINMSLGYPWWLRPFDFRIKQEIKKNPDILFVISAGNFGNKKPVYPASFNLPHILNVGAVDSTGALAFYSNYGKKNVDLTALGDQDLIVTNNPKLRRMAQGTSFSAPTVARLAGLILYENPRLSPSETKEILCQTVDKTLELQEKTICGGSINEERALELARRY